MSSSPQILLITPPMTQLNTPYPATAYLTGFLRSRGYSCHQADFSLELALRLFSSSWLARAREQIQLSLQKKRLKKTDALGFFLEASDDYIRVVEQAVRFLQGRDPTLATRIAQRKLLPEGPRFVAALENMPEGNMEWAFGTLGVQDKARYFASLFLDDLLDVVRQGVDPRFELSRYGEKLAASQPSFDPLAQALEAESTLVDLELDALTEQVLAQRNPDLLGLTVPFPGNVYGAFRIAKKARALNPQVKILMGGGYVNTELRELKDPRVFDFFDFVTLDDGERPLLCILESMAGKRAASSLPRTFVRQGSGKKSLVVSLESPTDHDIPQKDLGPPVYDGLPIDRYLSIVEMLNPMHRLWSDSFWNKLTLAHGCYWRKCSFCDITLDYIGRYDPVAGDIIVDRMQAVIKETGRTGFHFVDEAAPPAVLKNMAQRIVERGVSVSWWGNIRFDKAFTPELCQLLADSGCIAVTGGLEVASNRLLKLMDKGTTVEQVARVAKSFANAGVMVHAYLMYGFPTQTEQETVDALENVRQLFEQGCLHSAYWHRFSVTAHSPVGQNPDAYKVKLFKEPTVTFARNDLRFEDSTGCDHDAFGFGLKKALYNYMHGMGLNEDVRAWFEFPVPKTEVPRHFVGKSLGSTRI